MRAAFIDDAVTVSFTYADAAQNTSATYSIISYFAAQVKDVEVAPFAANASYSGVGYALNSDGSVSMEITAAEGASVSVVIADGKLKGIRIGEENIAYENGKYVIKMRAAFIDDAVTVKLTYADAAQNTSATYSIISYFAAQDANVQALGQALVAYAMAAEAYIVPAN